MAEDNHTRPGHGEIYLPTGDDGLTGEPFVDGSVAWTRDQLGGSAVMASRPAIADPQRVDQPPNRTVKVRPNPPVLPIPPQKEK